MPGIDILASNIARTRTVSVQVKTRRTGSWHTTIRFGRPRQEEPGETEYWIFVNIGLNPEARPDFFIIPAWWMQNSIYVEHAAYLTKHGGRRAKNPDSEHHAIYLSQIEEWRESWDQLGIFCVAPEEALLSTRPGRHSVTGWARDAPNRNSPMKNDSRFG